MDKADWDKVKEKLSTLFGKAELECDGYGASIQNYGSDVSALS